jgi:FkbM family methyltransferase
MINQNIKDYKFYSEFETDKYLREKFFPDLDYKGIMVEVGAGPPEFISNSKHFRDYGWRTIAVEPNPKFVKQHQDHNSEVYHYACSNEEKITNFIINYNNDNWYSQENDGVSYSSLGIKYDNVPEHNTQEVIKIQTIKLNTLLDKIGISNIDILSIDTEGWELEVMMGFDQEKYLPKVIVLENFQNNLNYEPFMNDRNYIKHSQLGYNEIYVRKKETEQNLEEVISNLSSTTKFDWGNLNEEYIELFKNENLIHRIYEKHKKVKPGDIVFDIGANYGSFTYSILDKKPKKVYCIEPSNTIIDYLIKNVSHGPVTFINKAISDTEEIKSIPEKEVYIYDHKGSLYSTTTFEKIIKEHNISKIDFLKFDCEGGEYSIFTKNNYKFIRNNITNFAGEWHINDHHNAVERFIEFRNLYLTDCVDLHVYERDGKDVTKDIFNDQYLYDFRDWWKDTFLGQFMIYFSYESPKINSIPDNEIKEIIPTQNKPHQSLFDQFSLDTENPKINFDLAYYYHSIGHTAAAFSHYLRCAERTDNKNLIYECLIRSFYCFDAQSNRDFTSKHLLMQAISLYPDRPEAYHILSQFYLAKNDPYSAYMLTCIALQLCNFNANALMTHVGYNDKYDLLYNKAIAGWHWEKLDEYKNSLNHIIENKNLVADPNKPTSAFDLIQNFEKSQQIHTIYDKSKYNQFNYKFDGLEKIDHNYSQCYQDLLVLCLTNGKLNGTYLEIGSGDPFHGNNTALLEKLFNWQGISIEIDKDKVENFKQKRKNSIFCLDATIAPYDNILSILKTDIIDYLQLDCDPPKTTFETLLQIPFDKYKFKIITYEHDYCVDFTKSYRDKSRKYLSSLGYELLVNNISANMDSPFEDWWIHPDYFSTDTINLMRSIKENAQQAEKYILS